METKEILRAVISLDEDREMRFSQIVSTLAYGAFNMKGQELEQVLGVLVYDYLESELGMDEPTVIIPQKKKGADLSFEYEGERKVDLKFYGGANRVQLSTLNSILAWIRNTFGNEAPRLLRREEKIQLINKISEIEFDYTLAIVSTIGGERTVTSFVFDFDDLDLNCLVDLDFELRRVAKEQRVEIHVNFQGDSSLEISAGGNPYNRGMWLNKITEPGDLDALYELGFIEQIFGSETQMPEFASQEYIRFKGRNILSYVDNLFGD